MSRSEAAPARLPWWVPGDWNAFFGLFTNVILNVLVLTGLCLGVVGLAPAIVFGRILPALGIALPIGNLYYALLARRLAEREGRGDVTAMPYGPSVPHMFIVVFGIMLPIFLQTRDAVRAWQAGLAWCCIIGIIILIGAFVGGLLVSVAESLGAVFLKPSLKELFSFSLLILILIVRPAGLFGRRAP